MLLVEVHVQSFYVGSSHALHYEHSGNGTHFVFPF